MTNQTTIKYSYQFPLTILMLIGACLCFTSCGNRSDSIEDDVDPFPPTPTLTPFQPLPEGTQPDAIFTLQGTSAKTQTPQVPTNLEPTEETISSDLSSSPSVWVDPALPPEIQDQFSFPSAWTRTHDRAVAEIFIELDHDNPISQWVYALVAPFPTILDGVAFEDLIRSWGGEETGPFA
jgi:hypothetical protein